MKFIRFDSGNVLIIAIAIIYSYFEQPWSGVDCVYTLHTCFAFNQVHLEALVQTRSLCIHSKPLNMSMKFADFDSGTVLIIGIAIIYSYFEQPW